VAARVGDEGVEVPHGPAWLKKPIIPAVLYVDVKTLPELISSRRPLNVATVNDRATLVADVKRMRETPRPTAPKG
jgi:hypothetical protein